eukprot:gene8471-8654_t
MALSGQLAPVPLLAAALLNGTGAVDEQLAYLQQEISCPLIIRRGSNLYYPWNSKDYKWMCSFNQPRYAQPSVDWKVDPVYYGYQKCACPHGHEQQKKYDEALGLDRMVCVSRMQVFPGWMKAIVVAVALLVLAILGLALLVLSNRAWQQMRFKPKYLRRLDLNKRRAKGAPKPGEYASVVVTDIEGYSTLMSAEPRLTVAALGLHNSIIRKAQYANAGVVLEQEGDSYTVAFHKPLDAISFCLQVQVALQSADWKALTKPLSPSVSASGTLPIPTGKKCGHNHTHSLSFASSYPVQATAAEGGGPCLSSSAPAGNNLSSANGDFAVDANSIVAGRAAAAGGVNESQSWFGSWRGWQRYSSGEDSGSHGNAGMEMSGSMLIRTKSSSFKKGAIDRRAQGPRNSGAGLRSSGKWKRGSRSPAVLYSPFGE